MEEDFLYYKSNLKYNQIKLMTHGKREYQSNQILAIYGIEFYGYLYDSSNIAFNCLCRCLNNKITFNSIFLLNYIIK